LSRREEKPLRRHLSDCPACAGESLLIAKTLERERDLAREMKAARVRPRRRIALSRLTVAAGAVVVVLAVVVLVGLQKRSAVDDDRTRGPEIAVAGLGQSVDSAGRPVLRWAAVPKSEFYVVEVYDDSLGLFWRSDKIRAEACVLPDEVGRKLAPGTRYVWSVTAHFADGRTAKSGFADYRLNESKTNNLP
jgi:hypothetical protein